MDSSNASSFDLAGGADTIVARATPPGQGALAVVRVSGRGVERAAARICPRLDLGQPRRAQLVALRDPSGAALDRAVVIPYAAPSSYTGEDMLELMIHGSPALTRSVMELFVQVGCRLAQPGEFTRRAVANGKMDLLQAEAVADLVAAETKVQLALARRHLRGELSHRVEELRARLIDLVARLEAGLDFAAQGVEVDYTDLEERRRRVVESLESLLATRRLGRRVREGVRVVLLGAPNAGKSTLFNRLLRTERSIVTPHPGTTRDFIEAEVEIAGLRVILVDTAGVGAGNDPVEREGIRRSLDVAKDADLLLVLESVVEKGGAVIDPPAEIPVLFLETKVDLLEGTPPEDGQGRLALSALTGEGWERFERRLETMLREDAGPGEGRIAVNVRQAAALEGALESVNRAPMDEPELAVEEMRGALETLGELLGEVRPEEVLDTIFSSFCLGK